MSMTFSYRARTPSGDHVSGTMRALDRATAFAALRDRMLIPSYLEAGVHVLSLARFLRRARPSERLAFFRAYAALEQSGVDFSTSFAMLIAQARSARMREALASIQADVELGGEKLWSAMSRRPDEFSDLEVAMVAAGEEAGNREQVFERLATFLERDERLRKRLNAALLYPLFVLAAACAVSLYLFIYVIPQFAALFHDFGVAPSPIMVLLLSVGGVIGNPFSIAFMAAACAASILLFLRAVRTLEAALTLDALRLRIPLLGDTIGKSVLARVCRVLATLLQSGVHQVRALEVAIPVAESPVFARAIAQSRDRIAAGDAASLDEALSTTGRFPGLMLGFIRVGNSAGNVPHMLIKLAEYYEEDVETVLSALPAAIQTAVTLGLGAIVAVIVYVVYVPLSTLSSSIH